MDTAHGSARLPHPSEAGLVPASAGETMIPLGSVREDRGKRAHEIAAGLAAWPAGQNVLVLGAPRSGKGTSLFLPAILSVGAQPVPPSVVVSDPKGELLAIAAGDLADAGYAVRILNWSNPALSHGYDALSWLAGDGGELDYTRAREMAETLVPATGYERDTFWLQAARLVASSSAVLAHRIGGTLATAFGLAYAAARDPEAVLHVAEETDPSRTPSSESSCRPCRPIRGFELT